MIWPFRRRKQFDAFGRPVMARKTTPPPLRPGEFVHAPDATPEEVPNGWRSGFDGYEIHPVRGGLTGQEIGGNRTSAPPWEANPKG